MSYEIEKDRCHRFQQPVAEDLARLDPLLAEALRSDLPIINEICEYLAATPGKKLRPSLLLLVAAATGGIGENALAGALAVELIHTATLVHDDILDNHLVRRGRETVFSKWGGNIATIIGDFLYSKAFQRLGERSLFEMMKVLARATHIMSEGELTQYQLARKIDISEETYMEMIFSKTASLFAAAAACGTEAGPAPPEAKLRSGMYEYGRNLGLAFQITDDLFDYIAIDDHIGKRTAVDFTDGRVTLPLIAALRNASPEEKKDVVEHFHEGFSDEDWGDVVNFVEEFGGARYSMETAAKLGQQAREQLETLPGCEERKALEEAVDYVIRRVDPFSG